MTNPDDSAYPCFQEGGVTKRELFAAMASSKIEPPVIKIGAKETESSFDDWAFKCCKMADALINELNKTK